MFKPFIVLLIVFFRGKSYRIDISPIHIYFNNFVIENNDAVSTHKIEL